MAIEALRRALDLSVAARDAALAGDPERVAALLDERTSFLDLAGLLPADLDSARAILVQIQRLDTGTSEIILDQRREIEIERADLRRGVRAHSAYAERRHAATLDRAG
ncbi:MAG: hypothetical protein U0556_05830 [Dehalococcoidia bacterium]